VNSAYALAQSDLTIRQLAWIVETFGAQGKHWYYSTLTDQIVFKKEKDYVYYIMRWA